MTEKITARELYRRVQETQHYCTRGCWGLSTGDFSYCKICRVPLAYADSRGLEVVPEKKGRTKKAVEREKTEE